MHENKVYKKFFLSPGFFDLEKKKKRNLTISSTKTFLNKNETIFV